MMNLNDDVLTNIIDFIDIKTILKLDINPFFNEYINNKDWKALWDLTCKKNKTALKEFHKRKGNDNLNNSDYKEIVQLAGFKGCMFCNNTRISKVHWEYKVRCCKDCLYSRTIGEWEFEKYLDKKHYTHLPYVQRSMYNSLFGYYLISFYWKESIDELFELYPYIPPPPQPLVKEEHINTERKKVIDELLKKENIDVENALFYSKTYASIIKAKGKLNVKRCIYKISIINDELNKK